MMRDGTKGLLLVVGLSLGMGPMGWLGHPPQLWAQAQEAPFAKDYKRLNEVFEKLLNFEIPFEPAKAPLPPARNDSNGADAGAVDSAGNGNGAGNSADPGGAEDAVPSQAAESLSALRDAPNQAKEPQGLVPPYTLADLIGRALSSSPLIRSAQANRRAAEADLQSARAQRYPTFALDSSASYIGNPLGPIVVKKGELGAVPNPTNPNGETILVPPLDTTLYKGMESSLYQFKVSMDLPLYTWGKIGTGLDAALSALSASRIKEAQTAHELGYRIQGTWEALAYVVQTEGVLDLQNRVGMRLAELARESYRSGFITRSELLHTEVQVKEIEVALAMAAEKRNRLLSDLSYLTGLSSLTLQDLTLEPVLAACPRLDQGEALRTIPRKNYDLAHGKAMLEAQRRMERLADLQGRGLPDIGLHLEASYGGPRFPFIETDWYGKDDYQVTFSIGTKGNLFGNPVKTGEALKARSQTEDAQARLSQGEQNVGAFIREHYLTLELQKRRIEYAQLTLLAQQEELERQKQLLASGSGTEVDYLSKLLEHLVSLADAYSQLASYRSTLLTLEAAGSE